jgi:phosphoribosylformimino-5-aminoimidazole carboxamide ribotide isomerase
MLAQVVTKSFEVVPAVDVLGTSAVRLERGEYDRVVAGGHDPVALVVRFVSAGARLVHVVDLDGARSGRARPELVRTLAAVAGPARIQASGGIRSPDDAAELLAAGAHRVVVGTAAFARPGALERFAARLGERLVVAVDVRGGDVVVEGWRRSAHVTAEEAAQRCAAAGVARLLCSAVERDGTLEGPDLELLRRVRERSGLPVLAAGGIRSMDDLDAVAAVGCEGAVVGRALLEGRLPLSTLASRPS